MAYTIDLSGKVVLVTGGASGIGYAIALSFLEAGAEVIVTARTEESIKNCKTIGLSSGASAPEELVQNFISEIKKDMKVSIEEVITANEKVVFKLPKELN